MENFADRCYEHTESHAFSAEITLFGDLLPDSFIFKLAAGAAKGVGVVEGLGRDSLAMASDLEREYDFVEEPSQTFFCPVSLAVLLEPYQTQCCGNHLSEEAYQRLSSRDNLVPCAEKRISQQ